MFNISIHYSNKIYTKQNASIKHFLVWDQFSPLTVINASQHGCVAVVLYSVSNNLLCSLNLCSCPTSGDHFVPFPLVQSFSQPPDAERSFILLGRNFHQWHCSTEQGNRCKAVHSHWVTVHRDNLSSVLFWTSSYACFLLLFLQS